MQVLKRDEVDGGREVSAKGGEVDDEIMIPMIEGRITIDEIMIPMIEGRRITVEEYVGWSN